MSAFDEATGKQRAPLSPAQRPSFLFVFDFDHTIAEVNSDVAVPETLGRGHYQKAMLKHKIPWTQMMGRVLSPMPATAVDDGHTHGNVDGITKELLSVAVRDSVVISDAMVELLEWLGTLHPSAPSSPTKATMPAVEVFIASDANDCFITEALKHRAPRARITRAHSNRALWKLRRRRDGDGIETEDEEQIWCGLEPFSGAGGHNCNRCNRAGASNMCKGDIVRHILTRETQLADPTVVYVGDGGNDFCPCAEVLRPRDIVLCRRSYPLYKKLLNVCKNAHYHYEDDDHQHHFENGGSSPAAELGDQAPTEAVCHAYAWSDTEEMLAIVRARIVLGVLQQEELAAALSLSPPQQQSPTSATGSSPSLSTSPPSMPHHDPGTAAVLDLDSNKNGNNHHNGCTHHGDYQHALPSLMRFYDGNARDFRSQTLLQRLPALIERTVKANNSTNGSGLSAAAVGALTELGESVAANGPVPVLKILSLIDEQRVGCTCSGGTKPTNNAQPLCCCTTQWLRNFAATSELRWGDLPWLQGEVYFNMLVLHLAHLPGDDQRAVVLVASPSASARGTTEADGADAVVGPDCAYSATGDLSGGSCCGCLGFHPCTPTEHIHQGKESSSSSSAPSRFFAPLFDVYASEKLTSVETFLPTHILPMLSADPKRNPLQWVTSSKHGGVDSDALPLLLRQSLWGNCVDLSMFSMDELTERHQSPNSQSPSSPNNGNANDRSIGAAVADAVMANDSLLVHNDFAHLEELVRTKVVRPSSPSPSSSSRGSRGERRVVVDFIMDNVGVECLADILLALYLIHNSTTSGGVQVQPYRRSICGFV